MATLREQLKGVEEYTNAMAIKMSGFVRDNYALVIARKNKEIETLKARIKELEGKA